MGPLSAPANERSNQQAGHLSKDRQQLAGDARHLAQQRQENRADHFVAGNGMVHGGVIDDMRAQSNRRPRPIARSNSQAA